MKAKWTILVGIIFIAAALFSTVIILRTGKPNQFSGNTSGPASIAPNAAGTISTKPLAGGNATLPATARSTAPRPTYPMADAASRTFLRHAPRLAFQDGRADANGHIPRVSLYRTNMKYPLLRVEETLSVGPNGVETVLTQTAVVADHIMVGLQPGATENTLAQLAAQNGGSLIKTPVTGLYLVQFANADLNTLPRALQAFGQSEALAYAEADSVVHASLAPNDPKFSGDWGMNNTGQTSGTSHADIDAEDAWGIVNQSPNVLVAVIDSGIDFNHPDLRPNIWTNPNPGQHGYANDVHGWNFVANNNNPQDDFFHGTHVSGTIGAVGNNGIGVAGVTWNVKLLPLKFLDSTGSGYTSDAISAITYATAVGARIQSNSWGGGGYSQALKNAIDAANAAGDLFVVAAGNDGTDTDGDLTYPADFTSANIISVAATDDNDQLASFSNYGPGTVQVAAPGVGILSTLPVTATPAMTVEGLPTSYGQISGTSMATPHVSGVAALALAQNPSLTVAELRAQILLRVTQLPQLGGVVQTAGRLNAYNVVNPNWQGSAGQLRLSATQFGDTEGNDDGTANPGEIIHLTPSLLNFGGSTLNGATVQITSTQSAATVLGSNTLSLGTLLSGQTVSATSPFRIQLAANVAVGTVLTFDFVLHATGVPDVGGTATVTVQASRGFAATSVNFLAGEITADRGRNVVYAIDQTSHRVLALDTNLGQLVAASNLDVTSAAGQMAVSIDDSKLYVVLPTAQKIQVFSLPSLTPLTTLPVDFIPCGIACGTSGRLFTTYTLPPYGASSPSFYEIDPNNGDILQEFGDWAFNGGIIHTSPDGTKLYSIYPGSGYAPFYKYDLTTTPPTQVMNTDFEEDGPADFAVNEATNRAVVAMTSDTNLQVYNWGATPPPPAAAFSFNGYGGEGIAQLPGGGAIWGASQIAVTKFDFWGNPLATYAMGQGLINPRGLAITPNGNVLCAMTVGTGPTATSVFALIGASSLQVNSPPPLISGSDVHLASVAFSDAEGNGDGVPNAGEIVDLTPSIANAGGLAANTVSVGLSGNSNATIISPASQMVPTVPSGGTNNTPTSFRVQLSSSLAVGTVVHLSFTVTPTSGTPQTYPYQLVVQPNLVRNVTTTNLAIGDILADQQRDVVYMVEKSGMEILAFDTDAGHITATAPMYGTTAIDWSQQSPGRFAESVDGTHLFLALPQTNTIQELSLPGLTTVAHWTYSFQPVALACDAQGRIYCSTTDPTQKLVQIDGTSGAVLSQTGPPLTTSIFQIGSGTILKRNAAGTEVDASSYENDQCYFYRLSTSGTGAPTQLAQIPVGTFGSEAIQDYIINAADSAFYAVLADAHVTVVPMDGSATSQWVLDTEYGGGNAITSLPNGGGVLASYNYLPSYIRLINSATGQDLYDYQLMDDDYNVAYRGMATTPNGKTLYVASALVPNGTSVDNYAYKVGLIGGTVDMQPPGPSPIALQSLAITDPLPGNADGFVHPGQTVQLAPVFKNFLNINITGVAVALSTTDSLATVIAPASNTIGNVASFATFTPSTNFKVAVSSAATDGHAIPLIFTVTYDNGAQQIISYTLYVTAPVHAETQVNFAIGDMLSDPTRDLAYVVDNTDLQLLAINTDTGITSKTVRLASSPGSGHLALSADGSHLYVALTAAKQIQVISLPDLEQSDVINLDFEPYSLAAGVDGKLYVSSADNNWEYLREIDPASGLTLGTFGHSLYYQNSILRLNSAHTTIYVCETGLSGYGSIDAYSINATGLPSYTTGYPFLLANFFDLVLDETYQRIYSASGGVYGVGVTNMVNSTTTTWSGSTNYAPYGCAVCFLPNGTFVYGGSYGEIRRYNRFDGTPLADFSFSTPNAELMPRGLAMTANGNILYATEEWTGNESLGVAGTYYRIGVIGLSSISITPTTAAPAVYAGADQTVHLSQAVTVAATVTSTVANDPVTWTRVSGPGSATINSLSATGSSISFTTPGTYQIKSTATQGSLTGSDVINITVLPDPAAISVTAPVATAISGGQAGTLTFTRTGTTSGAVAVSYNLSGNARSGLDYSAVLTGTTTIPDGSSSTTIPITALPTGVASSLTATVASSANYTLGVSQAATVSIVIGKSYSAWAATYGLATSATATPKNDGVPNLLKYVFDIDPTQNMTTTDRTALPTVGSDTTTLPGTQYLTLTYRQNRALTGTTSVMVQTSTDLQTWSPPQTPVLSQPVGTASNGDTMMEIGMPTNGTTTMFMRMSVPQ